MYIIFVEFYELIASEINNSELTDNSRLQKRKLELSRKLSLDHVPSNSEILASGLIEKDKREILKIKPTRTMSGVAVVAAMTSPERCPHGKCIFCPGGVDNNSPQSYTGYEPSALRGRANNYDPYNIVFNRLKQLETIGHDTSKVDLIIMGGTFTARDNDYQTMFVKGSMDAMNKFISPSLEYSIANNETASRRCIGLTVETKPDWFFEREIDFSLSYGTTKVELGVQILNDKILRENGRGHGIQEIIRSSALSRDAGLKIVYHLMPGMYGSSVAEDKKSFDLMVSDPNYRPDMLKIYPTLVVKGTSLYRLWKLGKYTPPDTEEAVGLITYFMKNIPPWIRVQRMQRDIPVKFIEAGVKRSDLRNLVMDRLREEGIKTWEIRTREIGHRRSRVKSIGITRRDYKASNGKEIFLSIEDEEHIYGYLRLRIPSENSHRQEIRDSSIVREIKVLGDVVPIGLHEEEQWQHHGLGTNLMKEAERVSKEEFDRRRVLVISGIGAREYFRKLGYERIGPYMAKDATGLK